MANIQVLDVQSTVPSYASHQTSAGRAIPGSETLLLAVSPSNARNIEFLSQNESLSVVQTQQTRIRRHCSSALARTRRRRHHDQPPDPRHQPFAGPEQGHPGLTRSWLRSCHEPERDRCPRGG